MPVDTVPHSSHILYDEPTLANDVGAVLSGHKAVFLVSCYPAVSHTFVLREVLGLRALGLNIDTVSINDDNRDFNRLPAEEQAEAKRTFYVKRSGWRGAIRSHFRVAV